jgi:hypothetical protein
MLVTVVFVNFIQKVIYSSIEDGIRPSFCAYGTSGDIFRLGLRRFIRNFTNYDYSDYISPPVSTTASAPRTNKPCSRYVVQNLGTSSKQKLSRNKARNRKPGKIDSGFEQSRSFPIYSTSAGSPSPSVMEKGPSMYSRMYPCRLCELRLRPPSLALRARPSQNKLYCCVSTKGHPLSPPHTHNLYFPSLRIVNPLHRLTSSWPTSHGSLHCPRYCFRFVGVHIIPFLIGTYFHAAFTAHFHLTACC